MTTFDQHPRPAASTPSCASDGHDPNRDPGLVVRRGDVGQGRGRDGEGDRARVAVLFARALEGGACGEDAEYELGALAFPAVLGRPGPGDPHAVAALLALDAADHEAGEREGWPDVPASTLARADQRHARLRDTGR